MARKNRNATKHRQAHKPACRCRICRTNRHKIGAGQIASGTHQTTARADHESTESQATLVGAGHTTNETQATAARADQRLDGTHYRHVGAGQQEGRTTCTKT